MDFRVSPPRIRQSNVTKLTVFISITMAGFMSFIARALDSIPGHLFCYSAISSAAIVGILPGYLIRTSPIFLLVMAFDDHFAQFVAL